MCKVKLWSFNQNGSTFISSFCCQNLLLMPLRSPPLCPQTFLLLVGQTQCFELMSGLYFCQQRGPLIYMGFTIHLQIWTEQSMLLNQQNKNWPSEWRGCEMQLKPSKLILIIENSLNSYTVKRFLFAYKHENKEKFQNIDIIKHVKRLK